MDRFFDEAARILASPISRRQAFGRLWKLAAGVAIAGAVAPASAQAECRNDRDCPGAQQTCCARRCIAPGLVCCGNVACPQGQCCARRTRSCTSSAELC
jgi:hypothetical protein